MNTRQIIEGLKDLVSDRESFIIENTEKDNIFRKDKEILDEAIQKLEICMYMDSKLRQHIQNADKYISNYDELISEYDQKEPQILTSAKVIMADYKKIKGVS